MGKRKKARKKEKEQQRETAVHGIDLALVPGEEVLQRAFPWRGATWHKYLYTLGFYGIWRKRRPMVITDHRVLIGKGVFVRTERSIPLNRVDNAAYVRVGPAGYCDVFYMSHGTRVTERLGPLSPVKARQFANAINARV